jgi:hypothetical protein
MMRDGDVVGSSGNNGAIYKDGKVQILPASSGCTTGASVLGSNSHGEAVGWCGSSVALYWANGLVKVLASPRPQAGQPNFFSIATGISEAGDIYGVGGPNNVPNPYLARFYKDGTPAKIFGPETGFPGVDSVNALGRYAFTEAEFGYIARAAFTGHGQSVTALLPKRNTTDAVWINDMGIVTGAIYHGDGMVGDWAEGYLDNNGSLTIIKGMNSTKDFITPVGIDDSNRVIGNYSSPKLSQSVFGYFNGTLVPNLSKYISPSGNYSNAYQGVSSDGDFVASGPNGNYLIKPAQ